MFKLSFRGSSLLVGAAACWGIGTVISKQALGSVPPLVLLPLQLLVSLGVVLAISSYQPIRINWSPSLVRLGLLGLLNPGLAYTLGLLGLTQISASMSVLLWALEPAFILVLGALVLREAPGLGVYVSVTVAMSGVFIVVYQPGSSGSALGVTLVLAAVACCAVYTVVARALLAEDGSLAVVLVQQIAALGLAVVVLACVAVVQETRISIGGISFGAWAAIGVSGALYYGFAFWLYLAGLRLTSASVAGSFLTLIPVFGLIAGAAFGEQLSSRQWAGAAIVLTGVAMIAIRRSAQPGLVLPKSGS
jgi:probable blue pigment (indigoidine) exporter